MPARLRDIIRALAALGVSVEAPSNGSHYKARNAAGRKYTIPAHNGDRTEITDKYIQGLCRFLDVDPKRLKDLL